jgi:hypothetical protein
MFRGRPLLLLWVGNFLWAGAKRVLPAVEVEAAAPLDVGAAVEFLKVGGVEAVPVGLGLAEPGPEVEDGVC